MCQCDPNNRNNCALNNPSCPHYQPPQSKESFQFGDKVWATNIKGGPYIVIKVEPYPSFPPVSTIDKNSTINQWYYTGITKVKPKVKVKKETKGWAKHGYEETMHFVSDGYLKQNSRIDYNKHLKHPDLPPWGDYPFRAILAWEEEE